MSLLGVTRHVLYENAMVPAGLRSRFRECVTKVRRGEPVQYACGKAPFLDFELAVNRHVLIPRPETEELVVRAIDRLRRRRSTRPGSRLLALDFGTGSGCIAIALCRLWPGMRVLAADCSARALVVARHNARRLRVLSRIRFVRTASLTGQLFARYRSRIDLLISNPPYIPSSRLARLGPRVREHEPALALDGGPEGTSIVRMLLDHGPALLAPGGLLALEVDSTHGRFLRRSSPAVEIERDLAGRVRYGFLQLEHTA